jgi:undecaprenyl diphosphate synthase
MAGQTVQIMNDDTAPAGRQGVPAHVAIIMDGNRRWAEERKLPVIEGHRQGVEAVRRAVKAAGELGVSCLTIYSFSTENWTRPRHEVLHLMNLLRLFIRSDLHKLKQSNVRVRVIGEREGLEPDIARLLDDAENETAANDGMTLVVAFNYGARQEMARAFRKLGKDLLDGTLSLDGISTDAIAARLDTDGLPDPDLIIRTSGEQRLSNFLLWQAAYAEFVFLPIYWPDFKRQHFEEAINAYHQRERRFGTREAEAAG